MPKIEDTMTGSTTWELNYAPTSAGEKTITLDTENTFVDKDIEINVSVAAGSMNVTSSSVSGTSNCGLLGNASDVQPVSGGYIKVSGSAVVGVTTGGWLAQGSSQSVSADDVYYPVVNATFTADGANVKSVVQGYVPPNTVVGTISPGSQTITGGGLSAGASSTALASNGLSNGVTVDSTKKIILTTVDADGYYELTTSGSATVNRAAVTKQVTIGGYFAEDSSAQTAIASGSETVTNSPSNYYVAQSTLSATTITSGTTQRTVTVSAGYYHEARTITIEPVGSATVVPSTGAVGLSTYFNAGTSSDNSITLTPEFSVTTAGYVELQTSTAGDPVYYKIKTTTINEGTTEIDGGFVTRGTASWGDGWVAHGSIGAATFSNEATSGTSYVDISATSQAPVLVAGSYLFINKGYVDDLKISLAKLVPDGSDVKGHANYILAGHSAYDNDGVLVAGSIQTYDGSYSLE